MIKKILITIVVLWGVFLISERLYWGTIGFLYPDTWRNLENSYKHKTTNFLIRKLYNFSFEIAEVAENVLADRKEKEAVPHIIRFLKSPMKYKRHSAMYALAKIGDKRAVEPVEKIIKNGRNDPDFLLAMKTLSYLHYEGIYPEILKMAKDNFHTSWVVGMLENYPDKSESISALKKISENDSEAYIREKAKKALVNLMGPSQKVTP